MPDQELIALLQKNPSQGLYEASRSYGGIIQHIIRRILPGREQDVEECMADVFVSLWKSVQNLECGKGTIKAYVITIARNKAIDRRRSLLRQGESIAIPEDFSIGNDPAETYLLQNDTDILRQLIGAMKEPERGIFIRRYFFMQTIKEIASALGIKEKAVENKLYRGRILLRKQLEERGVSL